MDNRALLFALAALFLVGCQKADQQTIDNNINHSILKFTTEEGVECIAYLSGNRAGISCNWDKYNKDQGE